MSFDSLYTGITGLNSYQSWIDMISNNIANVDTTGFKGQSMTFADLFYQNQGFATGPTTTNGGINPQQLGVGVKVNSIDTQFAQGGLQTTGVATNLAMNGDGFFILNNLNGTASPTYTRDGDFSLNSNGVLTDPASGLAVQGWTANANGVVTTGGATSNITIPVGLQEQATATGSGVKVGPNSQDQVFDVALGGNLDQTQWQQSFLQSIGAQANNGAPYTVTTTMYDSLGNAHQAEITYTPDSTGAAAASSVVSGAGDINGAVSVAAATNQNALITVTSNGAKYTVTDSFGVNATYNAGSVVTLDGATFTLQSPAAGAGTTQTISVSAAQSGLPSVVQNAAGTSVTPATRWKVDVSFTDGTVFSTIATPGSDNNGVVTAPTFTTGSSGTLGYAYFDQNGQFVNSSSIETATGSQGISGASVANYIHSTGGNPSIQEGDQLNVTLWGQSAGNAASAPTASGQAPATGPIGLDYAGSTLQGGLASLAGSYTANVLSQNGYPAGTLSNLTIGADGTVTGDFTNGQQKTLAQVAVATFSNEGGLSRVGGNQFSATPDSGLALVGTAGSGRFGSIQSGALEQSNVSLATEFTNMIIAQRAFEANTRGISTADQNLQTVINLRGTEN
jgi:flagellar hook protein FlgE